LMHDKDARKLSKAFKSQAELPAVCSSNYLKNL
jgi:hypothetical protein